MTIPPIIKKVIRNGRTLVYRVQDTNMDQETPLALAPQSHSVKSKKLVRRVSSDGAHSSYPSMIDPQLEHEDTEGNNFIITFSLVLTTATEPLYHYHYPDVDPAPETKQKETPEGKQKETPGTKRKFDETPTTTSSTETTVVTKKSKLEGSGSRGRIRTSDFDELRRSLIEETISIYRAQIGGVEPFPERTDDRETVKQAWLEVCTGRDVQVTLEEDIYKLVSDYSYSVLSSFVAMISLCRLSDVLHKHEATLNLPLSPIS